MPDVAQDAFIGVSIKPIAGALSCNGVAGFECHAASLVHPDNPRRPPEFWGKTAPAAPKWLCRPRSRRAELPKVASRASLARVRFTMSESVSVPARFTRHMLGYLLSGTTSPTKRVPK